MRLRAFLRLLAATIAITVVAAGCGTDDPTVDVAGSTPADPSAPMTADTHDHTDHDSAPDGTTPDSEMPDPSGEMDHDHELYEVSGADAPTLDVEVFADPAGESTSTRPPRTSP
ncbi:MAG: hypothetical protein R2695_09000 [Acidimicrobiales bacterium]